VGLLGKEKAMPITLSGGEQQRLCIARAIVNRPAMLVADEPTGNLDTVNTKMVYQLFRTINEELGTAFVIVTHDRSVAQQTDRILEISDGALLQDVRNEYAAPRLRDGEVPAPA
jgi:lipoprotein-releasing system ATP-binding protein